MRPWLVPFMFLGLSPVQGVPVPDALAGIGGGVLNPLLSTVKTLLSGEGLVEGALGALGGALGVEKTYDYVVVGGGTAGNAVAYRLAEAGFSVAVVEAGLFYEIAKPLLATTPGLAIVGTGASMLDSIPTVDWEFQTEPQAGANNRKIHYARGKCLGGSSALNFMAYHRATEGSLNKWAGEVGDDSYRSEHFMPYFDKSVTFTPPNTEKRRANASTQYDETAYTNADGPVQLGYANWVSDWATWLEKGLQAIGMEVTTGFNSGKLLGYHYATSTLRSSDQTRSSSAEFIHKAAESNLENLKVYTQTLAQKVIFDNKKKATGVQVSSLGSEYTIHASKEVILSAGAFQSPQLLMLSGVGPRSTLDDFEIPIVSELPGVGQNLWDHVMFGPSYPVNFDTVDRVFHDPVVLADALNEYLVDHSGPLAADVADIIGWEKLPQQYRDAFSPETREALSQFPDDWPEVEHIGANAYIGQFNFPALEQPLDGKQYATILGALVAPLSRGNVTIASASAHDLPLVNPNFLAEKADQEVAVAFYRRMREVWQTDALQQIVVDDEYWPGADKDTDEEILEVVRDSLMTVWHAAGTCMMGKQGDPKAVIDSKARVFGVEGVRVVDASSMPILPPGHPQSTIYALAEKIADDIIKGQ
ncbi:hypothetical protein F4779DRAFT_612133 [Xylariaceae sp. FL0662B]|nr:hypothetical protein F4779DRAFT_612133 [Xylariaceae sp. FL0662B]